MRRFLSLAGLASAFGVSCTASPTCPPPSPPHLVTVPPRRDPGPSPCETTPDAPQCEICEFTPDAPQCQPEAAREPSAPRCRADDPNCGPEFFESAHGWRGPHGEHGDLCLRPMAPRYPTGGSARIVDRCDHDGDCRLYVVCGVCLSYRRAPPMCGVWHLPTELDQTPQPPTWCGCVDHGCTLFTQ